MAGLGCAGHRHWLQSREGTHEGNFSNRSGILEQFRPGSGLCPLSASWVPTAGTELAGGFVQAQNFLLSVHYVEIWNIVYCVVCLVPMLYSLAELGGRMRAVRKRKLRWYDSLRRLICTAWRIALHDNHLCATSRCCITGPSVAVMCVVSMHALFQKSSPCGTASVTGSGLCGNHAQGGNAA